MYTVSSAARAIQSGQALGANVIILDPSPPRGLYPDLLSYLCRSPNPNHPRVDRIYHLPPRIWRKAQIDQSGEQRYHPDIC